MKYAAADGASFGGLRFLISLKLSKLLWDYCHFWRKNEVFELPLAEIKRYRKSEMAKRCAVQSCIFHIPNTILSNQYLWPESDGSLQKSSIFDGVRPLPRRHIIPAGSKTGTVANTSRVLFWFSSFFRVALSQALTMTHIARILDRSGFILFMGFEWDLFCS